EVGRDRAEVERAFGLMLERRGIIPDPADAVLFQQVRNAREVPALVAELDGEAEVVRQLVNELAEGELVFPQGEVARELDEHTGQLAAKRCDAGQERREQLLAFAQLVVVRD